MSRLEKRRPEMTAKVKRQIRKQAAYERTQGCTCRALAYQTSTGWALVHETDCGYAIKVKQWITEKDT